MYVQYKHFLNFLSDHDTFIMYVIIYISEIMNTIKPS